MTKIKNRHVFSIRLKIIYMGWEMLQKLPVNKFEWINDTSQLNKDFIKNYIEKSDQRMFSLF